MFFKIFFYRFKISPWQMKPFNITILGCGSATPSKMRNPSSQIVNVHDKLLMFDCAEGTQIQMRRFFIKSNRINHIFISHLHGDHYLGLMGLLFTYHLFGRQVDLHIHAPKDLKQIIEIQLNVSDSVLSYPLIFHELLPEKLSLELESKTFDVYSFPLKHSIETWGFIVKEKYTGLKINKDFIRNETPSFSEIQKIKMGNDYVNPEGILFRNSEITFAADKLRSYAYCSDTLYDENIIPFIENVSLLYHEATFAHNFVEIAHNKFHSTASEAALMALKSNAHKLLIGHFSARYEVLTPLLDEAKMIFENTVIAEDGLKIEVSCPC